MFVILGASGNTGEVVANNLLAHGEKVRVVGRNAQHLQPFASRGAEVVTADATNPAALTSAFQSADAAYVLLPPNPGANDFRAFQDQVSDAIARALTTAGIKHVVALSSFGADKPSGTGPVAGLYQLEQKLNSIKDLNALYLRAGYFMENTLPQAGVIKSQSIMVGPLSPTLKLPLIATRDIGNAAAAALLRRDFRGKQIRELQGQRDLDYTEIASIIGKAIGKPALGYIHAPDDQLRPALQQMGMSPDFVNLLLEMSAALNSGQMKMRNPRSPENTTPTSFETFVSEEFLPAYRQQAAA
jgi:uncharacterized protein YbjT (DUF2867 family)